MRHKLTAVAVAAITAAGTGTFAAVTANAAPASGHHSAASGTEHVVLVTTNPNGNPHALFTGPLKSAGLDREHNNYGEAVLPGGTFRIGHPGGKYRQKVVKSTCTVIGTVTGKYTLSHGTGDYAGIKGHGKYVATVSGLLKKKANGSCNLKTKTPADFSETIVASGPITLAN